MAERPQYNLADHICHQAYALDRALARAYQVAFAGTGMTYPKYLVLLALDEDGPQAIGALSARLGVETNTLSPLLKKMADFGTITRERSPRDERQVVVALTEYGGEVLAAARPCAADVQRHLGLSEGAATDLVETLKKMRAALAEADPLRITLPPR